MDMTNIVTISQDAYGRYEVIRRRLTDEECGAVCAWCGQPAKFEYGVWNSGVNTKPEMDGRAFCSINCRRAYQT